MDVRQLPGHSATCVVPQQLPTVVLSDFTLVKLERLSCVWGICDLVGASMELVEEGTGKARGSHGLLFTEKGLWSEIWGPGRPLGVGEARAQGRS